MKESNFCAKKKAGNTWKKVLLVTGCAILGLGAFVGGAVYGYQEAANSFKQEDSRNDGSDASEAIEIQVRPLSVMTDSIQFSEGTIGA